MRSCRTVSNPPKAYISLSRLLAIQRVLSGLTSRRWCHGITNLHLDCYTGGSWRLCVFGLAVQSQARLAHFKEGRIYAEACQHFLRLSHVSPNGHSRPLCGSEVIGDFAESKSFSRFPRRHSLVDFILKCRYVSEIFGYSTNNSLGSVAEAKMRCAAGEVKS